MIFIKNSPKFLSALFVTTLIIAVSCTNRKKEEIIPSKVCGADSSFQTNIKPIIESKCFPCHSANGNSSDLSTYDNFSSDSASVKERINLPQSDSRHMPTQVNPQLDNCELAAINKWVKAGAKNN